MDKLGMKSVSALTIYAVMHGYVDVRHIVGKISANCNKTAQHFSFYLKCITFAGVLSDDWQCTSWNFSTKKQSIIGFMQPVFIAGPCVIESEQLLDTVAERLVEINSRLGVEIIFKASFDKANRTSIKSFRGPGLEKGLQMLQDVKTKVRITHPHRYP